MQARIKRDFRIFSIAANTSLSFPGIMVEQHELADPGLLSDFGALQPGAVSPTHAGPIFFRGELHIIDQHLRALSVFKNTAIVLTRISILALARPQYTPALQGQLAQLKECLRRCRNELNRRRENRAFDAVCK